MTPAELLPWLLLAQGVVGGIDTLLNHELLQKLPHRVTAHTEISLHSARELLYGCVFLVGARFEMTGAAALCVLMVLSAEALVTLADEFVENRTRVLPQNERVLHVLLTLNLGWILAVAAASWWNTRGTGWTPGSMEMHRWILAALGLAALAWSARDFIAWRRLSARA